MTLRVPASLAFGASLAALLACSPDTVAPRPADAAADRTDAAADALADAPLDGPAPDGTPPADAAPDATRDGPCGDGGVCAGGQRCDTARMRCVDCLATAHCGAATPVCASGRCVAATPCNSSRMCPGQVCDLNQSRCVDCVADADCDPSLRCVANVCVATVACRSSRDCSANGLVCDTAAMRCVECVEDRDCPMGQRCGGDRTCAPQTGCTPGVAACASNLRVRECNAMGVTSERDCAVGEICMAGACRMLLCSPGAVSCESATARRTCNADGMAYTVAACAAGATCVGGECRVPGCTPGMASCASATERRVCNADGMTFATMACPTGQTCAGGTCAATTDCPAGQTRCGSACVSLQTDAANCGRCANACPSGAACDAGMCAVATAPMLNARVYHALVVLPDGRVLAIGGLLADGMTPMREVERYDPTTNRWEPRAPLPMAQAPVKAAVLDDGRVVVGGIRSNAIQVYTPATDSWAQLTTSVGGSQMVFHAREGRIYAIYPDRVGIYELAMNRWSTGAMLAGTSLEVFAGAVDSMGRFHAFSLGDATRRAVYEPASNTWMLLPGYGFGRLGESIAFTADGSTYGFGGSASSPDRVFDRVRRIDLVANTSTPLASMREARAGATVAELPGGRILVTGGLRIGTGAIRFEPVNTAAIYTIATNTWR